MTDFRADLFRYFGNNQPRLREIWRERTQLLFLRRLRKAQRAGAMLTKLWHRGLLSLASHRTGLQIPHACDIGPGLRLGHLGTVVINPGARIGRNCNIASGVTIGATNRGRLRGAPILGDAVWIGTNAVLVGNIRIGTDVLIAPNSYVNFDVPDHSVVLGNPGLVRRKQNATEGYIENRV